MYNSEIEFEWDDDKRESNLKKHGIDFIEAREIWLSPLVIEKDDRYAYGEERYRAFGMLMKKGSVICIYTKRENNIIRIISLRKANKREIKSYEQNNKK